ncbi:MAG: FAD-dependent oxidoreductase [Coriobacteriales bacterium]|jgi:succinate dehydrogenase/fumarate reductase flavoprotein subunit
MNKMNGAQHQHVTRRSFVAGTGAALAGAAVCAASVGSAAHASEAGSESFDQTYDVIVIGYGTAGGTAAFYAAKSGAKVLLVDSAPKGEEGGNSRFCGQIAMYTEDIDGLKGYLTNLGWEMDQDADVIDAYARGLATTPDIMRDLGAEEPCIWSEYAKTHQAGEQTAGMDIAAIYGWVCPEYPELGHADAVDCVTVHDNCFDGQLYATVQGAVEGQSGITVWLESPAKHLVQADDGTITGAIIEHEGTDVRVGANKGVVLACGGFECNRQMVQDYLGVPRVAPIGGLHNFGDGVRMGIEVGADLWHMHNYESLGMLGGNAYEVADGERCKLFMSSGFQPATQGAIVVVAEDGSRYFREDYIDRHGHVYSHGTWRIPNQSYRPFMVIDEQQKSYIEELKLMPDNEADIIVSADTAEELGEKIGVDPDILARTIERFNGYAQTGEDIEFDRPAESMRAFEGTLYALPLQPAMLNTQGGPRRNAKAQVVDTEGEPIPHLFSAGECGGVNAYYYQGTGNIGECLVFGKIAGTNAAQDVE